MSGSVMEKRDQSQLAAETVASAKAAFDGGANLDDANTLEALLNAEKKCRLANDAFAARDVAQCVIALCIQAKAWTKLNENLKLITKRRAQSKVVVCAIVAQCVELLKASPDPFGGDLAERETLLKVLREITDGKMYVEAERAEITRMLAMQKEAAGAVAEAADILQEVNVETYGSLSKREKVDYILEQVRLMLAKGDLIRSLILSKKVQRKILEEDDLQDLKVRFFRLMAEYHVLEDEPYELAQCFWAIFSTKCVQEDEGQWTEALSTTTLFLALSEHAPQVQDMMHRVLANEASKSKLDLLPTSKAVLKLFTTDEIIAYPIPLHQAALESHAALATAGDAVRARFVKTLHTRVVQHNIRVVAKYYRQLRVPRLAQLLGLSENDAEQHVAHMVSDCGLYCKIDRPAGIVHFQQPAPPDEILSDWAGDISKMLSLVEMTCHLINKENMIHKIV
ncbi:hypothetical protein M885DRAFT_582842 [Pelagophyceae sp. CCMP2097]|nr:hypothetical protein M885DRAFT_582842 [Pelagophyceae sp. CCMP2097]|eukprot:CAMPEP_0184098320 /NCGR_PEP_ID=MMETSP0974-20121125/11250_1 /TAXON_ID=483370 /ORGANISM="non described non described, Strain CCMP2097" /LENGTH=452 /DNA_ID=CAMNT_0026401201 /DNA_START=25 /DNA_END=1383 /DNA_ORIENTATION=+